MAEKENQSDEMLLYTLERFSFDEKAAAATWNKALSKADFEMDRVYYQHLGYIGFPIGEHLHKFFDCPIKAEAAIDAADKACEDAFGKVMDDEFYNLIDL